MASLLRIGCTRKVSETVGCNETVLNPLAARRSPPAARSICGTIVLMTKLIRDPQLDQLVKELNRERPAEEPEAVPAWPPAQVPTGNPIEPLLAEVARRGASDL